MDLKRAKNEVSGSVSQSSTIPYDLAYVHCTSYRDGSAYKFCKPEFCQSRFILTFYLEDESIQHLGKWAGQDE